MAASTPAKRAPRKAPAKAVRGRTTAGAPAAPTSASAWRKGAQGEDLVVPSGNVCRVRRVGITEWLKEGIVPDSLRPIIDRAIAQGQGANMKKFQAELTQAASDPQKIREMFDWVDRAVAMMVSQPTVVYHKRLSAEQPKPGEEPDWEIIPDDERNPEALYTDELQDEDKFFLFNYAVGGVRDLERFRQEFGAGMAALHGGEDLG